MSKKTLTILLISTMIASGAALAQTSTSAPTPAPASGAGSSTMSGGFITEPAPGEIRGSKLVGLNVYGPDNLKVGDINDVLIDRTGMAKAAIIGVGGFLGIGEKSVAVPFSALEWSNARPSAASAANPGPGSTAATAGSTTASTMGAGTTVTAPSGVVGATAMPAPAVANAGTLDHAVLRMTQAELQTAPTFKYDSGTNAASTGTVPGATAPRQ